MAAKLLSLLIQFFSGARARIVLIMLLFLVIVLFGSAFCFLCFHKATVVERQRQYLAQLTAAIAADISASEQPPHQWLAWLQRLMGEKKQPFYLACYRINQEKAGPQLQAGWGTRDNKALASSSLHAAFSTQPAWVELSRWSVRVHPAKNIAKCWVALFTRPAALASANGNFMATLLLLLVAGMVLAVIFSWVLAEWFLPVAQDAQKILAAEITSSNKIFANIHTSWSSYINKRNQKKRLWTSIITETSRLNENLRDNLQEVLEQLGQTANILGNQSGKVQQTSDSLGEMSSAVKAVVSHAEAAVTTSTSSETDAKRGGEIVSQIIRHMNKITQTVSKSASVIRELGKRSEEIVDIINVIDDIADQTDLLALNAAIEAARAGAQGRGFAVVADQVRSLAEKTSHATKEISATLSSIREKTTQAVAAMDEGIKEIDIGAGFAVQAGVSLRKIVSGTKRVSEMVSIIAQAAEKQSQAATASSDLVSQIARVAQTTCEECQNIVAYVQDMERRMKQLTELIEKFLEIWSESYSDEEIMSLSERTNKEILLRNQKLAKICASAYEAISI